MLRYAVSRKEKDCRKYKEKEDSTKRSVASSKLCINIS